MRDRHTLWEGQTSIRRCRAFFTGDTALRKGMGVCFHLDWTDDDEPNRAQDPSGRRTQSVALPSSDNNLAFAGIVLEDYAAKTGGQIIDIALPGSRVYVDAGIDTVVGETRLTCSAASADAGRFTEAGMEGLGTVLALQTRANVIRDACYDGDSTISGATLTATGKFSDAEVGDIVVIVGGDDDDVEVGEYEIETVTSDNAVELDEEPGDGSASFYVLNKDRSERQVLALVMDGAQSGLTEWITPLDDDATPSMVGGTTFIAGGYTIGTDDATFTLADGLYVGLRKRWVLRGSLGTNDYVVTTTTAKRLNGTTDMDDLTFGSEDDDALIEWLGPHWQLLALEGATASGT